METVRCWVIPTDAAGPVADTMTPILTSACAGGAMNAAAAINAITNFFIESSQNSSCWSSRLIQGATPEGTALSYLYSFLRPNGRTKKEENADATRFRR